ncbi:MAG: ABC-2 family transporter protein [Kineosporiaceae bacterium]
MTLRAYYGMGRAALKSLLAYQTTFLFGLLASTFSAAAMLYLWRAVLASGTTSRGFDWPTMKTYLLVAFVFSSLVSGYVDYRMAFRIRQGEVALDLVRPVDYQWSRFAEAIGFAGYELGTALIVAGVAASLFGGLGAPSASALAPLALSAALVLPLRFAFVYVCGLSVFWTQNYQGVHVARIATMTLFSGNLVPLAFLPGWLQATASASPFAGMASTPALIWTGVLDGGRAWVAVGVQAVWVAVLWGLARALWTAASRQLTVHGG